MKQGIARRFCLGLVAALMATSVGAATAAADTAPVKPATMTNISIGVTGLGINLYWDLMVARDAGFFAANNLNPTFVTIATPATLAAAAAAGSVNFVVEATDGEIGAIDAGGALKLIAGEALGSFSLVSQPSIKTFADLKGKKIAVSDPNTGSTLLLLALLKKNGVARTDVTLVQSAATAARLAALQAGAVDASLLSQPADFTAADAGFTILGNTATAIRQYQITSHAVNTNFAQANPAAVVAYVRSIRNAQQFLWNPVNEAKALQIFETDAAVSASVAQRCYDLMFKDLKTMSVNGVITSTAINNVLNLMQQTIGGGPRTPAKYYDQTFLADSLPPVAITTFSASKGKGVVVARIFATRASTASLRLSNGGTVVGKGSNTKLVAGKNIRAVKIPAGLKAGTTLTLTAVVKDSAGNTVTKTTSLQT